MNSQILSTLFVDSSQQLQLTDILSSVSDSVPIIYANSSGVITTYNARFFCLGNLLIQFNDSANTVNPASFDSLTFPYPYDATPYSVVSSNYSSAITFTKLAISLSSGSTNFNFLSIGPRPSLFYPVVPFLTTGSPQISVGTSNDTITFTFNQSGTITFYKSGTITSYTAIGAGGNGGNGYTGSNSSPGGGGGGGEGGLIVSSTSQFTCDSNSTINIICGINTVYNAVPVQTNVSTSTTISPPNTSYSNTYTAARVGRGGEAGTDVGVGGDGGNAATDGSSGAGGQYGTAGNAGQSGSSTTTSGGGGGGGGNGGNGGDGGAGWYNSSSGSAGSGGGGAGGKSNTAGTGGTGLFNPLMGVYASVGGTGGSSGPATDGINGVAGSGGGGGAGGSGKNTPASSGGYGGLGGSGKVVFVIQF